MEGFKRGEGSKDKTLALKATEREGSDFNEDKMALLEETSRNSSRKPWEKSCDESYSKTADETSLMDFKVSDSNIDEEDEVSVLDLKNKLDLFSKKKLNSLMISLTDNFHDIIEK
ncbi:hypothetical protein HAX54_028814 [Datura stramonium]|uniref:Uncharacterized protein n=1 Tax=Datura stramonium TaxID=4076 RepID=A0ABS8V4R3_DATST|nr:hypothetical protein [Datura stramonium]